MNTPIISDDLLVVRTVNGVKLVKPLHSEVTENSYTIGQIKNLPISFYFLNLEGATVFINQEGARICGFTDADQSIGKTLQAVSKPESAEKLIHNCSVVIQSDSIQIFEEENQRKDDVSMQFLSIKAPWYNDDNMIIGIMGCSIVVGKHSLSEAMNIVRGLGLLDNQHAQQNVMKNLKVNNMRLTQRELQCLKLTIKGYTAKRIAKALDISHRTVEEYLTKIRSKTGAGSKAELIEMTIDNFYL